VNKTQVKKLLVAERKAMRVKQRQSAWMRKTANIFAGMRKRAHELKQELPFTLKELRDFIAVLPPDCIYCFKPTTASTWTLDHYVPIARGGEFGFSNIYMSCKSCNWQKGGTMTGAEFQDFLRGIELFAPEVQADIKRRLTIGGKWGVRVG
jgi:5-methylcytosine-specific restriction endonuclease McrA